MNHLENEVLPAIREVEALNAQADSRTSEFGEKALQQNLSTKDTLK